MSVKVKFNTEDIELDILYCSYSLYQEVDAKGRPSTISRGGQITIEFESANNMALFEWMCNSTQHKDGHLIFQQSDTGKTLKELHFKKGYLINFTESFQANNSQLLLIRCTISALEISMGKGTHINQWP